MYFDISMVIQEKRTKAPRVQGYSWRKKHFRKVSFLFKQETSARDKHSTNSSMLKCSLRALNHSWWQQLSFLGVGGFFDILTLVLVVGVFLVIFRFHVFFFNQNLWWVSLHNPFSNWCELMFEIHSYNHCERFTLV